MAVVYIDFAEGTAVSWSCSALDVCHKVNTYVWHEVNTRVCPGVGAFPVCYDVWSVFSMHAYISDGADLFDRRGAST